LELVNVWDVASARTVASTPRCEAIATASAAIAAAHGYDDGEHIPLDLHLAVLQRICAAVDLPVTADLERGYGDVSATIQAALHAGVVGANLEDAMCPAEEMCQRVAAAVEAGAAQQVALVLNARTDVYLGTGDDDEDAKCSESIGRGRSYLEAGADCIFVPGCTDTTSIGRLVAAFGPGRLSLLAVPGVAPAAALEALGVARLSHGPYPQRHALAALAAYPPSAQS
jgi:2-methylisocitrate lyase-like PEP mutase family enzyme